MLSVHICNSSGLVSRRDDAGGTPDANGFFTSAGTKTPKRLCNRLGRRAILAQAEAAFIPPPTKKATGKKPKPTAVKEAKSKPEGVKPSHWECPDASEIKMEQSVVFAWALNDRGRPLRET